MFNPHSDDDLMALRRSLRSSYDELLRPREHRHKALRELVGQHYTDKGTDDRRILNMIELAWSIYKQQLVASSPQTMATSRDPELLPDAYGLELALNRRLQDENLQAELELWVMEAMFAPLGVLKVYLDVQELAEIDGEQIAAGPPKAEAILFPDWVQDTSATSLKAIGYCGNRYQVTREFLLTSGLFDTEAAAQVPQQEEQKQDKENLGRGRTSHRDDYRKMVSLWDIWLPAEKLVITVDDDFDSTMPPLRIVNWTGPPNGPYHFLYFSPISGSALPLPPVAVQMDLHEVVNALWNKLARQAERQKNLSVVIAGHEDDGEKIRKAEDGSMPVLSSGSSVVSASSGGIDQANFAFALQNRQLFKETAGNLDALGGLNSQAETLGQDELLTAGASQRIRWMQSRIYVGVRGVARDYAWYMLNNPLEEVPITLAVQGSDAALQTQWRSAEMRAGLENFDIDVVPTSMQTTSPQEKLQQLRQVWHEDLLPAAPVLAQAGISLNPEGYLKAYARLAKMPEMENLVIYAQGQMQPPNSDTQAKPQTTTRRYERVSRPGATQRGHEQQMIAKMMGAGGMNQEPAA